MGFKFIDFGNARLSTNELSKETEMNELEALLEYEGESYVGIENEKAELYVNNGKYHLSPKYKEACVECRNGEFSGSFLPVVAHISRDSMDLCRLCFAEDRIQSCSTTSTGISTNTLE